MLYDLLENFGEQLREAVHEKLIPVTAKDLGLDIRAGGKLWIDPDDEMIVVSLERDGSLQYYGGFEYIRKDLRKVVGEYVIYLRDPDEDECRVSECMKHYEEKV